MRLFFMCLCVFTFCGCNFKSDQSIVKHIESILLNGNKDIIKTSKEVLDPQFVTFTNIDVNFIGVYLPIKYIKDLDSSRNHSESIHKDDAKYHNYLCVFNDRIESSVKWHDGYTIKIPDGNKFRFVEDGEIKHIYDQDNFEYIKISDDIHNADTIIKNYILNCIFKPLIEANKLQIHNDKIIISDIEYDINLDDMFWPGDDNAIIFNREKEQYLGLKIINDRYVFYEIVSEDDSPFSKNSENIVYDISLE